MLNGSETKEGQVPSQLLILRDGKPVGGGTIISESLFLTAASLVFGDSPNEVRVAAGRRHHQQAEPNEQIRQAAKITIHEDYDPKDPGSPDLALIEIASAEPFLFNDYVEAVALPPASHTATGTATISGWGATIDGGPDANLLHTREVTLLTDSAARDAYGTDKLPDGTLYAASPTPSAPRTLDVGGPATATVDGKETLVGIITQTDADGTPYALTKVAHYLDWIKDQSA